MKGIVLSCFFLLLACAAWSQTASDYYRSPVDTVLTSAYLGERRQLTIILPRTFSKENAAKFPLVLVFDRQNQRIFRQIAEEINYLVSFDEMPEAVIIGISTDNGRKRYLETSLKASDENASGEKLVDFLYKELIPWAEAHLNCGRSRVFIGHSRFGYFTSYLLANKLPDLTAVISCSPFFLETRVNLVDSLRHRLESTRLDHTVYYRFITGDSVTDTREYGLMKSFLDSTRPDPHFNWKGLAFYDAKHMAVPGLGVMPSLLEVFDYWSDETSRMLADDRPFTREAYDGFKQRMKDHYGTELGLGLAPLNGIGYKFYNAQKYPEARAAWTILLREYPGFTDAYLSIAKSWLKEGNEKRAIQSYLEARNAVAGSVFYSEEQKGELRDEISNALKPLLH